MTRVCVVELLLFFIIPSKTKGDSQIEFYLVLTNFMWCKTSKTPN